MENMKYKIYNAYQERITIVLLVTYTARHDKRNNFVIGLYQTAYHAKEQAKFSPTYIL